MRDELTYNVNDGIVTRCLSPNGCLTMIRPTQAIMPWFICLVLILGAVLLSFSQAIAATRTGVIATGSQHSCGIVSNGTVKCWGNNAYGQLGNNSITDSHTPVSVSGISTATAVTAGWYHSCALLSTGTVQCWGWNANGQLGNTSNTDAHTPVSVTGLSSVTAIAAGWTHTCALFSTGAVKCWGSNNSGQLGNNSNTNSNTPVSVIGLAASAVSISAGGGHTCAALSTGAVQCWGSNGTGQLGNNNATGNALTPVSVVGLTTSATAVAAGAGHGCALLATGSIQCWGNNAEGEIGNNSTATAYSAVSVIGLATTATAVSTGNGATCALMVNGTVQCWGSNTAGQLGVGTFTGPSSCTVSTNYCSKTPVTVLGISTAADVSIESTSACSLLADGTIKCWGNNAYGQLGNNSTTDTSTPVTVIGITGLDITPPTNTTGSNFINSGAVFASTVTATLSISATDIFGVTGYYASQSATTPSSSASGWVAVTSTPSYSTNASFTLSTGDGTKTVYVWFKDAAGNVSTVVNDSIALDTVAPTFSSVTAGGLSTSNEMITWMTNEAADSQVEYGLTTSYGSSTALDTTLVTSHGAEILGLTAATTYHYRVKSKDTAGNLAASGDFTFTTSATGGTIAITYTYDICTDGVGSLCSVTDESGSSTFAYDSMGRITSTVKTVDSINYPTGTAYDDAGRAKSISYPDGDIVYYSYSGPVLSCIYSSAGCTTTGRYAKYTNYNALGQAGSVAYGNGVGTTYTYCPNNFRLCGVGTTGPGGAYQNLSYTYDYGTIGVGNITTITDGRATGGLHTNQTQTFGTISNPGYDALNRLILATGPYGANGAGTTVTYTYDTIGNMTCNSQLSSCTTGTPNYNYLDSAHAHAVTSVTNAAGRTYAYDPNGNMIQRGADLIAYDGQNRMASYAVSGGSTTSFVYDGDGGRVKKSTVTSTGTTATIYIGKIYECVAGSCTKHLFAGAMRIASKQASATAISYYHTDHLGSTSVVTDQNGVDVAEYVYRPFGETSVVSGLTAHYQYTGQERDGETALYFYNARYYDPALGRFVQADTIVPGADSQALNRYSYTGNNPINAIDPSGHWPHWGRIRHHLSNGWRSFEHVVGWTSGYSEIKWAYQHPQQALQYATIAAGVALAMTGNVEFLPLLGAVSSGGQVALAGGSFADISEAAMVGAVAGAFAGGAGQVASSLVTALTTNAMAGAIAGIGVGGFVGGALPAGYYGGNAIRAGYQGAITAVAMAAAMTAINYGCKGCLSPPQAKTGNGYDQTGNGQAVTRAAGGPDGYYVPDDDGAHIHLWVRVDEGVEPGTVIHGKVEFGFGNGNWTEFYNDTASSGQVRGNYVEWVEQVPKGSLEALGAQSGAPVQSFRVTPFGYGGQPRIICVPNPC